MSSLTRIFRINRFKGCLVGLAIGDAMGMPAETLCRSRILQKFGWINTFLPREGTKTKKPAGSWTDETHLAMLTAKSILECRDLNDEHLTKTYIDGLQQGLPIAGTTKKALELRMTNGDLSRLKVGRHAGGGAAARVAPIALYGYRDLEALRVKVETASRITHQDDDAVAGAVGVAFTIAWALREELNPQTLIYDLIKLMREMNSNLEYSLKLVQEIINSNMDTVEGIEEIGTDGATMRLIPSALLAFLKSPDDFEKTVLAAVNAGGDTDTRAAIAGAISGAYNGLSGIPQRWIHRVQDSFTIIDYATRLYELTCGPEDLANY